MVLIRRQLFISFLLCFTVYASAQTINLSGVWSGALIQEGRTSPFNMILKLHQNGDSISGTAKFIAQDASFAEFTVVGTIKGTQIRLDDIAIANEKSPNTWFWCKKIYTGKVELVNNQIIFTGNFKNDGYSMFTRTTLIKNSGRTCAPGSFTVSKSVDIKLINTDTIAAIANNNTAITSLKKEDELFIERKIEVKKRIEILSDSIELNFYDNGDIDNDTITVYYNKQMILNKQRLSDRPVTVKINVKEKSENEIVMFADNLGSIPPNTAILIFEDKGVRHEVKIDSNLKSSGSVYIYRK